MAFHLICVQIVPSVSLIRAAFPQLCMSKLSRHSLVYENFTGLSAAGESHFKITLLRMMTVLIAVGSIIRERYLPLILSNLGYWRAVNPPCYHSCAPSSRMFVSCGGCCVTRIGFLLINECQFATELETDALHLWITALRSAAVLGNPSGDSSLSDLFPKVISLLADNWGVLGNTIDILEGYLLLDANSVLQVRLAIVHVPSLHSHATSTGLCFSALYCTQTTFNGCKRES
jgi:hypothetical protein